AAEHAIEEEGPQRIGADGTEDAPEELGIARAERRYEEEHARDEQTRLAAETRRDRAGDAGAERAAEERERDGESGEEVRGAFREVQRDDEVLRDGVGDTGYDRRVIAEQQPPQGCRDRERRHEARIAFAAHFLVPPRPSRVKSSPTRSHEVLVGGAHSTRPERATGAFIRAAAARARRDCA